MLHKQIKYHKRGITNILRNLFESVNNNCDNSIAALGALTAITAVVVKLTA